MRTDDHHHTANGPLECRIKAAHTLPYRRVERGCAQAGTRRTDHILFGHQQLLRPCAPRLRGMQTHAAHRTALQVAPFAHQRLGKKPVNI